MHPFTWINLKKYNCKYLDIKIPRHQFILEKYKNDKLNGTCSNNILLIKDYLKKDNYLIMENTYPYYFEKNILHYIFWFSLIKYNMEDVYKIASDYFSTNNIIISCNIEIFKSVPEIDHYHIFILKI